MKAILHCMLLGLVACQSNNTNQAASNDPIVPMGGTSGPSPRHGYVQITLDGETHNSRVRIDNYATFPSWRTDLLNAADGSPADLSAYLKTLAVKLKKRPEHGDTSHTVKTFSLDLVNVTAQDIVAHIHNKTGVTFVGSLPPDKQCSVRATDAPWQELVDVLANSLRTVAVQSAFTEVLFATPDEFLQKMETRVYRVKFSTPAWNPPVPPPLPAREVTAFGGVPYTPPERKAQETYREELKKWAPNIIITAMLSRTPAGKDIGRVDFDPMTKCFIVQDTKESLARVKRVIDALETLSD